MRTAASCLVVGAVLLNGCALLGSERQESPAPGSRSAPSSPTESTRASGTPLEEQPTRRRPRPVVPRDIDPRRAETAVAHLAGRIGSRHATSAAYARAAEWVTAELRGQGYEVARQPVRVPGGVSWGVPVPAGRSVNVVAAPRDLDPTAPHLVVGAHLDTVPQAPGAEDNASGVGVMLAAAAAVAGGRSRLPVVWVAFGAEEPRGDTDDDHHYGSRAYVAGLSGAERRAVRGMVSLDRVGVGATVPVGSARDSDPVQRALLAAARRTGTPAFGAPFQRSSDHWSFVRAGIPGARLGSTPYAAYHSPTDRPDVVDRAQLARTGRLLLAWLAPAG